VVVVTMGPPQARGVLRGAGMGGADRAIHLCHPAFAGADTLATARALAAVARRERPDLILCGRASVDADTGQVGPELAALLGWPQVTAIKRLEVAPDGRCAMVDRETDEGTDTVEVELPAVLTCAERLIDGPRIPSIPEGDPAVILQRFGVELRETRLTPEERAAANDIPTETLAPADLGVDEADIGTKGSPTWVGDISMVKAVRRPVLIDGSDPERAVADLLDRLDRRGAFDTLARGEAPPLPATASDLRSDRTIWVVVEVLDGEPTRASLELLGSAAALASQVGGRVEAVLLADGSAVGEDLLAELAANGTHVVWLAEDGRLAGYAPELHEALLVEAIAIGRPWAVWAPASSGGRDYLPRVAARLGLGLTGDAIGIEVDDQGRLAYLKPAFGGTIVAQIYSRTVPQMATIRPGALTRYAPDPGRMAEVRRLRLTNEPQPRTKLLNRTREAGSGADELDHADVVVAAGFGIGRPENLSVVANLAEAFGAAMGATRRVTDAGWLPRQLQIGITGRFLAPRLYIGVAVGGEFNHTVGIAKAGTVVAINNNPEAPICRQADFVLVGDFRELAPALAAKVRDARLALR
jgi:electron transfer flavoprotein alpha subunit